MSEEFPAEFMGKDTIFRCYIIIKDNGDIFAKTPSWFPGLYKKRLLGGNLKTMMKMYQERFLLSLDDGRMSDLKVRVYPFDLDTFDPDFGQLNPSALRELESLRVERDFLFQAMNELKDIVKTAGMSDRIKDFTKREHEFYTGLRPPFVPMDKKDDKKRK